VLHGIKLKHWRSNLLGAGAVEISFDHRRRPTGLGEIGVPFITGAISNAFFRLSASACVTCRSRL
jgi:hypothetical protein